jgi:hypothetical protein
MTTLNHLWIDPTSNKTTIDLPADSVLTDDALIDQVIDQIFDYLAEHVLELRVGDKYQPPAEMQVPVITNQTNRNLVGSLRSAAQERAA